MGWWRRLINRCYFDSGMMSPCLRYFAKRFDDEGWSSELKQELINFMKNNFSDSNVGLTDADDNFIAVGYCNIFDLNFLLRMRDGGDVRSWIIAPIPAYYGAIYYWLITAIGSPPSNVLILFGQGMLKTIVLDGVEIQLNIDFEMDIDMLTVFEETQHTGIGKIAWKNAIVMSADAIRLMRQI